MIIATQTSVTEFTPLLTGVLPSEDRTRLTGAALDAAVADLYPIFFTQHGLPRIYGNHDHYQASVLQWDCECGEVFSGTFDGRDEMFAHRESFSIDGPQTRAQTEAALLTHLIPRADVAVTAERLYTAIGLDEIDLSLVDEPTCY